MLIHSRVTRLGRKGIPGAGRPGSLGSRHLAWDGGTAAGPSAPTVLSRAPLSLCGAWRFAKTPEVTASCGGRAGWGRVIPSGEASLDSPGYATESHIPWSCLRNPARKRASESWGGIPGLLSEEFRPPQAAAVLNV